MTLEELIRKYNQHGEIEIRDANNIPLVMITSKGLEVIKQEIKQSRVDYFAYRDERLIINLKMEIMEET